MDTKKLKQFQILNQLSISSESITCAFCKSWLTQQIFLHSDGIAVKNCCQACSLMLKTDPARNAALENVLKDLLFPCKYADCDFILKGNEFDDHVINCACAPNVCNLCDQKAMTLTEFKEHLKTTHADKVIMLEKPLLSLTLEDPTKNDIIIATFHEHIFLLHVKLAECMLSVNVAKIRNNSDRNVANHFTAYCRNTDVKKILEKCFTLSSKVSINSTYNADLMIDGDKPVNLEIFLCDFEKALQFADCPICHNDLGLEVYQCVNGHNVCAACGAKIKTCAICRSNEIKIVKLRSLFPNALMSCPNFEKGCLAVNKGDNVVMHAQTCAYSNITCVECAKEVWLCNIKSHMNECHALLENMQNAYMIPTVAKKESYISFKNEIFKFSRLIENNDNIKCILYTVQLLFNKNKAASQRYKYEIHITDKAYEKSVHILRGVCQDVSDNKSSSWIYYNTCADLVYADDADEAVKKLNFRYVIIEVNEIV